MYKPRTSQAGFTLIELMMVIAILGVLSAISLVSFAKYRRRARTTEAYNLLGMIRMRQETYRSEFSQYADVSGDGTGTSGAIGGFWPTSAPTTTPADWYAGLPAGWTQLGVRPTNQVYFRYDTVAGNPGVVPAFGSGLGYAAAPNQDAWWAAHAYGDLNGNGVQSTFEAFSLTSGVWVKDNNPAE